MSDHHDLPPSDDAVGELLRRALRDVAPPPAVFARAVSLRGPARRMAAQAGAVLRRLIAVAVPMEAGSPFSPAFGMRGSASVRHWLFRADDCEIDLRIAPRGERWAVSGQVFGAAQTQRVVLSSVGAEPLASAELGPTREFAFSDLVSGRYRLTLQGGELEVVIPEFDVGPA